MFPGIAFSHTPETGIGPPAVEENINLNANINKEEFKLMAGPPSRGKISTMIGILMLGPGLFPCWGYPWGPWGWRTA